MLRKIQEILLRKIQFSQKNVAHFTVFAKYKNDLILLRKIQHKNVMQNTTFLRICCAKYREFYCAKYRYLQKLFCKIQKNICLLLVMTHTTYFVYLSFWTSNNSSIVLLFQFSDSLIVLLSVLSASTEVFADYKFLLKMLRIMEELPF